MLLKDMIKEAESFWALYPGQSYSYPHAEPSDGALADRDFIQLTGLSELYSEYRQAEGQKWGPYVLNGFYQGTPVKPDGKLVEHDVPRGRQQWRKAIRPTHVNNWLLREFDKHVKSLPGAQQLSGGIQDRLNSHALLQLRRARCAANF